MPSSLVALCVPIQKDISARTHQCMIDLVSWLDIGNLKNPDSFPRHCVISVVGMPVHDARNAITKSALAAGADYLMWIDSDMTFAPSDFFKLFVAKKPICGGLCFGRRPPYAPIIARYNAENKAIERQPHGYIYDYPKDALLEVDLTGGAFILHTRKVYDLIPVTAKTLWWSVIGAPYALNEDSSFCHRARLAGIPIFVHTGTNIGHVGAAVVNRQPQGEPK